MVGTIAIMKGVLLTDSLGEKREHIGIYDRALTVTWMNNGELREARDPEIRLKKADF